VEYDDLLCFGGVFGLLKVGEHLFAGSVAVWVASFFDDKDVTISDAGEGRKYVFVEVVAAAVHG
jgi:hypothetical protein